MKLEYFDLLSPEPTPLYRMINSKPEKIGTLKPITPRMIAKTIGFTDYNWNLSVLLLNVPNYFELIGKKDEYTALSDEQKQSLDIFDIITTDIGIREMIEKSLSFFMCETVKYIDKYKSFITLEEVEFEGDTFECVVGAINNDLYSQIVSSILQLNGIHPKDELTCKVSKKAQMLLDKINKAKEQIAKNNNSSQDMELANIMSKLSAKHNSINILNIWDMTIYQIYDQFNEQNHQNIINIKEMNYSYAGGDFDATEWYKRLNK